MMRLAAVASLIVFCVAGCEAGNGSGNDDVYIASQSDFASYAGWEKFTLGIAMNTGHPVGTEYGFRNQKPVNGAYPVGSVLVKEIDITDVPQQWELFALMKRGGGYNGGGAKDWEFATLRLNEDLVPIIVSRGANPADSDSQGHGYAGSADGTTCNRCHGIVGTELTDHVLDDFMAP
jgi:hypothetical protein